MVKVICGYTYFVLKSQDKQHEQDIIIFFLVAFHINKLDRPEIRSCNCCRMMYIHVLYMVLALLGPSSSTVLGPSASPLASASPSPSTTSAVICEYLNGDITTIYYPGEAFRDGCEYCVCQPNGELNKYTITLKEQQILHYIIIFCLVNYLIQ